MDEQALYDIKALADHLRLPQYAVLGYSHGGVEAAKLLTVDRRAVCGVIAGTGAWLADEEWKASEIADAADLEASALDRRRGVNRSLALAGFLRGLSVTSPRELGSIDVPVLCIAGYEENSDGAIDGLRRLIRGSELALVDGDHRTAPMQPEFREKIVSFISTAFPISRHEAH